MQNTPFFSLIIPVFNRPDEIQVVLECLVNQSFKDFELIIIEDGSTIDSELICSEFSDKLNLSYFKIENCGQGYARNYGMQFAKANWFVILDSDIIIPTDYLLHVKTGLENEALDAFGGPDSWHPSFTSIMKANDLVMTSWLTSGGTRTKKKSVGKYFPRTFNLGFSRQVLEAVGGFKYTNRSEDIELSVRMYKAGFKVGLIPDAVVFHKRKDSIYSFFKQTHSFGKGRIFIKSFYEDGLKAIHFLPIVFCLYCISIPVIFLLHWNSPFEFLSYLYVLPLGIWKLGLFLEGCVRYKSFQVGFLAIISAVTFMFAYASGMIIETFTPAKVPYRADLDTSK